jgi:hypothetical protein
MGIGVSRQKLSYLSPVFYKGFSLVASNGKTKIYPSKIISSTTDTRFDFFQNWHNNSKIYSAGFDFFYTQYYLLPIENYHNKNPDVYLGWEYRLNTEANIKPDNVNNNLYYLFNNMICLSIGVTWKIKTIRIFNEFNFPLMGIYSGSNYSHSVPYFVDEDAKFLESFDILFLSHHAQIHNRLNIDFQLNIKNQPRTFRFRYLISAEWLNLNNNITHNTFHFFQIGYLFNKIPYVHQ